MRRRILVLAAVLVLLYPFCTHAAIEYEVIDLGTLGGERSSARSINDVGQIVGGAKNSEDHSRATLFDPTGAGNNIDLGTLGGDESWASCINNTGQIVGRAKNSEDYNRATLFDPTGAGNNIDLGTLGGDYSYAESINNVGQIVGVAECYPGSELTHAILFDPTGVGNNIDLGTLGGDESSAYSINDAGQIVGVSDYTMSWPGHATLFDATGASDNVSLDTSGGAQSINNAGQIVGSVYGPWAYRATHAALFDVTGDGNNIDLGTLGGSSSRAYSINDTGQIVGWAYNSQDVVRATLFDLTGAGNNIDLNTLIDPASGWTLEYANDINNNGWIVGQGINPQGQYHAFLLVPISTKYSGGTGEPNDPYQIASAEDLMLLGESTEDYDKHFILTAGIDLDPNLPGGKVFNQAVIAPDTNDVKSYFQGTYFTGVFDGSGHMISNLHIQGSGYLGLFGRLDYAAKIYNLGLEAVDISGTGYGVGSLIGLNSGDISNCYSTGTVSGNHWVGGLVGDNGGDIDMCYSTANVSGNESVGGLVGFHGSRGSISSSISTGTVTGDQYVGGLVGENQGSIKTSYSTGMVTGYEYVGGLVGYNDYSSVYPYYDDYCGSITMSYSIGTVNGNLGVGGLVGYNKGETSHCYSKGTVSGDQYIGGFVGINPAGWGTYRAIITSCYSVAQVHGNEIVGGFAGSSGESITTSFWDIQISGQTNMCGDYFLSSCDDSCGKTTAEMQTASIFLDAGWDFMDETDNGTEDIWGIVEDHTYPLLSWQKYSGGSGEPKDPYQIATAKDLILLGETPDDYDKHFILTADIDLDPNLPGRKVFDKAVIAPDTNDAEDGFQGTPFTGVFDGNEHTISCLSIEGGSYLGLFGRLGSGAIISSLGLEAVDVNGTGGCVGGLVGTNGLIGWGYVRQGSRISCCYSTGTVTGSVSVGGLVGTNSGIITACYTAGAISGNWTVGGLVGLNAADLFSKWKGGIVADSYSTCSVSGQEDIAGLVGQNGIQEFPWDDPPAFGACDPDGIISNCYSTGRVEGILTGGLVAAGSYCNEVGGSFWNTKTSGQATSVGGTGKTTAEMQTASTFLEAGWDFVDETVNGTEDIWWIDEGQDYPHLWWEAQ